MGCLVQSVLAVEDNVPNGLEGFLTREGHLEGSKRRAKTPATKKKKKPQRPRTTSQLGKRDPPFLCPWPPKWTLAWVPLGLLPTWMGSRSVRKVSSQPGDKAIKFPPDPGQGCLEKRARSWDLALGGQVHPAHSTVIWTKVASEDKVWSHREAGKTAKH